MWGRAPSSPATSATNSIPPRMYLYFKWTQPTIGIDFISKNIAVTGKMVRLQLWDTAGQERFKSLIPSYLKDAHLAIVVFDLTSSSVPNLDLASVDSLNKWIDFIRESGRT